MSPECIPFQDWDSYSIRYPFRHGTVSQSPRRIRRSWNVLFHRLARGNGIQRSWNGPLKKGHEIATHTYNHTYVHQLDEQAFASSIDRSPGYPAITCVFASGHRASRLPAFSLDRNKEWQFKILRDRGILYDSSINPQQNYLYGDRTAPPASLYASWSHRNSTFCCGAGLGTTVFLLEEAARCGFYRNGTSPRARIRYQSEGHPPVIYVHPWEFVPEHPPHSASLQAPFDSLDRDSKHGAESSIDLGNKPV